jgi:HK97 family phage major capsid protein
MFAEKLKALSDKIAERAKWAKDLQEKIKTENRDPTDEEVIQLTQAADDVKAASSERDKLVAASQSFDGIADADAKSRDAIPARSQPSSATNPKDKVFAIPRAPKNLVCFKGANAAEEAYKSGKWCQAALFGSESAAKWCRENGIVIRQAAMSEGTNTAGGFLVTDEFESNIINLQEEYGVIRANAKTVPMASDTKIVPRRTGGLTAYPVGEGSAGTSTDMSWDAITLVAKTFQVQTRYSNELNEDSVINLADEVGREMAAALAYAEDNCGFNGTGAYTTYHRIYGILSKTAAGSIHQAASGNITYGTLDVDDYLACIGKLKRYPGIQPKWFVSPECYANSMQRLDLAAGGTLPSNIQDGANRLMFLGYPVVLVNVLSGTLTTLASTNVLAFGDMRMSCMYGQRRGLTIQSNPYTYMDNRQVALYGTQRFDFNYHDIGTSSDSASMIVLEMAAS